MVTPYIDIYEADDYFNERMNISAWEDATDDDGSEGTSRLRALKMATKIIDRLNFAGNKAVSDQENQFPRGDDAEVPQDIMDACAEIALALLDGVDPELEFENLNMIAQQYSSAKSTYDRSNAAPHIVAGVPSIVAWYLLIPYLRDNKTVDLHRVS